MFPENAIAFDVTCLLQFVHLLINNIYWIPSPGEMVLEVNTIRAYPQKIYDLVRETDILSNTYNAT